MEFHEKLQQLRKKNNLTQEQLAERLFVSRTAVSKWESGRGYPNLESLKYISRLFSISIDDLLSNEELIELAETESHENISKVSILVFGALDIISIAFLFLPLFGQQDGEFIYAVPLLSHTSISGFLRTVYFVLLAVISIFGVFEIITGIFNNQNGLRIYKPCSVALYAVAISLFILSRQPYITVILFLLFIVKIILIVQENRIKLRIAPN